MEELPAVEAVPHSCAFKRVSVAGFDAIQLVNRWLSLTVVPEIGGKIVSIKHLLSQREWLASNGRLNLRKPKYGGSFVADYDTGGFDECFPSIAPIAYPEDPWQNHPIPDHGELWCQPWVILEASEAPDRLVLSMACHGVQLPYRFERRLVMTAASSVVYFEYQVTNLSSSPMPFVWSMHPIFQIEAGMRLILPDIVKSVRIDGSTNEFLGGTNSLCPWPLATDTNQCEIDLSQVPSADFGQAVKFYTLPLTGADKVETAIYDPNYNRAIGFRFRCNEVSHIGVWMNYGGWSGSGSAAHYNLGLEPCIGGADSLINARRLNQFAILNPYQKRKLSVEMFVC